MKILLMCGAGASSGFMAQAMRKAAKGRGIEGVSVEAKSDAEMLNNLDGVDLLMVGPHLAYKEGAIRQDLASHGVPYVFIDRDAYGSLDGEKALDQALAAIEAHKADASAAESRRPAATAAASTPNDEPMTGLMGWISDGLAPKLNTLTSNVYIASIQQSIMSILPMIMIGSVASIVGVLRNLGLMLIPDISMVNTFSFGLISVFLAVLVPMKVMEKRNLNKLKISCMLTSVALYLIVTLPAFDGEVGTTNFVTDKLGTGGMLAAVLVGCFVAWAFSLASRHSFFKQDTVMPDMVVEWIDALVPVTFCLVCGLVVYGWGFDMLLAVRALFSPIATIGQTWYGTVIMCFLVCFLYSFGFTWILFPISWAIWMDGMSANMAAVAAGQAATNINLMETIMGVTYIGGQGLTLSLVILCIMSRSKRLRAIGKVTLLPGIFNINEPIVFGAPVVWNPILMIPLWLNSIVATLVMYVTMAVGLVPVPSAPMQMWYLPTIIQGFLVSGIPGALLVVALFVLSYLIWLPFFKVYERQVMREEAAEGAAKELVA